MLLNLASLALSAAAAVAPAPAVRADSTPLLTVEAMTSMTNFWAAFMKEPDSIKTTGRKANQEPVTIPVGKQQTNLPGVVNMNAMAAKFPAVAADLKKAGLTSQQWEGYRAALLSAALTKQVASQAGTPDANSALGKNVAFLDAHQKEFDALKATGMWFPQIQAGGGGGMGGGDDDLNP